MLIEIRGMTCAHCIKAVEKALRDLKVLKNIKVENGRASFDADQNIDQGRIRFAIEDAGYEVISIK